MAPLVLAELAGSASYGGGERYLELLFAGLDRNRVQPLLVCPEPGPFARKMEARGVPTQIVHLEPLINPLALFRLAQLLGRERVTVLQTHGARANAYGRIAGRLAGVPVIVSTVHNSLKDYGIGRVKRGLYRTALRLTLPLVDRIVCVSEALRADLIRESPRAAGRTVVVYNGVDHAQWPRPRCSPTIRREFGIGSGPLLVVIGRLTKQKGHRYLIQALPQLLTTWPQLKCLIVGEGELLESLRALAAELGVAQACLFAGVREDIPSVLSAADVVVLPSISEGFPFVLLEALAMSRPVVATTVNGVPELLEDRATGRLVPPRNPEALAAAVRDLLNDPSGGAAMGLQGRHVVRKRFTAERMVAETLAVFDQALCERGVQSVVTKRVTA